MTRVLTVYGIAWGCGKNCEKLYWRLIIHMSSTGNAEQLAAVSCQLSVEASVLTFVVVEQLHPRS
jgi:hypothetical protein